MTDGREDLIGEIMDMLTVTEVARCRDVLAQFGHEEWIRPLAAKLGAPEGWTRALSPFLFELRVGGELRATGVELRYEQPTGEGDKSADFAFDFAGATWFLELHAPRTSMAVRAAITRDSDAGVYHVPLSAFSDDPRQSPGAELIRVQHAIIEKATKLPRPIPGRWHLVLIDARRVGITGVGKLEALQIAVGPDAVGVYADTFKGENVRGLFEQDPPDVRDLAFARERLHFIAFSNDRTYGPRTLLPGLKVVHNPLLFTRQSDAEDAWRSFPTQSSGSP